MVVSIAAAQKVVGFPEGWYLSCWDGSCSKSVCSKHSAEPRGSNTYTMCDFQEQGYCILFPAAAGYGQVQFWLSGLISVVIALQPLSSRLSEQNQV